VTRIWQVPLELRNFFLFLLHRMTLDIIFLTLTFYIANLTSFYILQKQQDTLKIFKLFFLQFLAPLGIIFQRESYLTGTNGHFFAG